jgi:ribonuclease Z
MPITLTILGSGSGDASPYYSTAGYCLTVDERHYIFDCGSGTVSAFLRAGYDPLDIQAIFISHMHPDHHCDLPLMIQKNHLVGREAPLAVYLPSEAIIPYKEFMTASYLIAEKFAFKLEVLPISASIELHQGRVSVNAVANNHLRGAEPLIRKLKLPNKMQCFSFRIIVDNKVLFYSADIAELGELEKYLDGLDLLIIETTHIDLKDLKDRLEGKEVRRAVLSHIGDEDRGIIENFVARSGDGTEYLVAEDNLVIDV